VDREALQADYEALDKEFRLSEKEEIKKYLEIGKTPAQYYKEQQQLEVGSSDSQKQEPSL